MCMPTANLDVSKISVQNVTGIYDWQHFIFFQTTRFINEVGPESFIC